MPLYEYRCDRCGKRTEVIQTLSEKPLKICPHCGERALRKMLSAPAIQFKGSGWYVTDYAGKKREANESGSEASGGDSAEAKKPEKTGKSDKSGSERTDKPKKGKKE